MNKTAFVAFIAGAAIGSVATWQFTKKKYEKIAQEQIDDVKEHFSIKFKHVEPYEGPQDSEEAKRAEQPHVDRDKPDVMAYAAKLAGEGYKYDYSASGQKDRPLEVVTKDPDIPGEKPYVISPEEFGEFDDYTKHSLTYYADGVLCDDMDHRLDDNDPLVLMNPENHFGEYEEDSVFIRNDMQKSDYEILRSLKTYAELIEENPYKAEV